MSSTTQTVVTPHNLEDWLIYIAPIITLAAGFNISGIIPGTTGIIAAIFIGALSKYLIGFAQNPHLSNWEDWLAAAISLGGFVASGLESDPTFLQYGVIVALVVKSLPMFSNGINIEDGLLFAGAVIAGLGTILGHISITDIGLIIAALGKGIPSIGTNGAAGMSTKAPASVHQAPAPVPSTPAA